MSRTRLLLPLTTVLAALVLPAAANASFQARIIDPTHVNLIGSDEAEHVIVGRDAQGRLTHDQASTGFASPLDFDTATPGVQSVTGTQAVIVDGEGGDDRITLTATSAVLHADGGEDADIILGAGGRDIIQGGLGADFADGGAGADRIFLGAGDDSYGWNPSSSSDRIDGGDGDDTAVIGATSGPDHVEVSGDDTRYAVDFAEGGGIRLQATERLSMSLFDGDDELISRPMPLGLRYDINGGVGDDTLMGGRDDDRIDGGSGHDQVLGTGGDDVLFGESLVGDDGNDRMTLVTTDPGPLSAEGEGGYDVTSIIGTSADEAVSLARQGAFVTAPGLIISSEAIRLDARRGNDSITVGPGVGTNSAVTLEGGDGDDVVRGSDGIEWLSGGLGQDLVDGGLAPDHLTGGADADVIRARDRAADTIDCQTGDDIVIADLANLDSLVDAPACEHVDRAAATGASALARVATTDELQLGSQETVKVPVACSAGARGGCQGTVALVTAEPILMNDLSAPAVLGSQPFSLAPGTTAEVAVVVFDREDLARAAGGRLLPVNTQVLTATAEHTTLLSLNIVK
jgi:Ca2+-binding RTX toxin-like protein